MNGTLAKSDYYYAYTSERLRKQRAVRSAWRPFLNNKLKMKIAVRTVIKSCTINCIVIVFACQQSSKSQSSNKKKTSRRVSCHSYINTHWSARRTFPKSHNLQINSRALRKTRRRDDEGWWRWRHRHRHRKTARRFPGRPLRVAPGVVSFI